MHESNANTAGMRPTFDDAEPPHNSVYPLSPPSRVSHPRARRGTGFMDTLPQRRIGTFLLWRVVYF